MAKSVTQKKGIWAYIQKRGDSDKWQFAKRWPADLEDSLGKFDRQSLKTSNDREAEIRALDCLQRHELRVKSARSGTPFHDLSAVNSADDLSQDHAEAIQAVLDVWFVRADNYDGRFSDNYDGRWDRV